MEGVRNIDIVITSPPYPNRISYIRELRPYMYWLKYINNKNDSSNIDWDCIGGTWGAATSNLLTWKPKCKIDINYLQETVNLIEKTNMKNSELMSKYVYKYFNDMFCHIHNLYTVLNDTADVYYIVGNSTFFQVNVDSDILYKIIFEIAGFTNIESHIIRKRNCNKKLYEYCITAKKNCGITPDNSKSRPTAFGSLNCKKLQLGLFS
jgi:hypothetical protein